MSEKNSKSLKLKDSEYFGLNPPVNVNNEKNLYSKGFSVTSSSTLPSSEEAEAKRTMKNTGAASTPDDASKLDTLSRKSSFGSVEKGCSSVEGGLEENCEVSKEKKRKLNREAAQRSRTKKAKQIEEQKEEIINLKHCLFMARQEMDIKEREWDKDRARFREENEYLKTQNRELQTANLEMVREMAATVKQNFANSRMSTYEGSTRRNTNESRGRLSCHNSTPALARPNAEVAGGAGTMYIASSASADRIESSAVEHSHIQPQLHSYHTPLSSYGQNSVYQDQMNNKCNNGYNTFHEQVGWGNRGEQEDS
eukprot:Nk52_evm93s1810 gene=Nk52_evmTU93s1810